MSEELRARMWALALASIVCLAVVGIGAVGGVGTQQQATVAVELSSNEVTESNTVNGAVTFDAVDDADGVGSFTVELVYDSSAVSVTASDHPSSEFDVETASPSDGTLRVTGYTGNNPGPTDKGILFAVQVAGGTETASTSIDASIDSFTDAEGDSVPASTTGATLEVTADTSGSDGTGDTGDDGGTGGGGGDDSEDIPSVPASTDTPMQPVTDTPTQSVTDTPVSMATETSDDQDMAAGTPTPEATEEPSPESTGGSGPGFGVTAAVVAALAAAVIAMRRRP